MLNFLNVADISGSGLAAERMHMQVIANNVANANSTRSELGGPYRRQLVVFAPALSQGGLGSDAKASGVRVVGVKNSDDPFQKVYEPSHPDADATGHVQMPNVSIAHEMVSMITASRSYEANLQSLKSLRSMVEQTLSLLRAT